MGERHTRQGQPHQAITEVRGLDEYEERDWQPRPRLRLSSGAGEGFKVIGSTGCWCGLHQSHDWPGRADGAPHPREAS